MSRTADKVLKDWGDKFEYGKVKKKGIKNVRSGASKPEPTKAKGPATRESVSRTVNKAPEVMVKISGGGKNMRQIKAHMDYISRNGEVELEDENGQTYHGKEDVRDVRDAWAKGKIGIPENGESRKEAFNIVLSMPPGTDRRAVKDAARAFAAAEFDNHQYVFAAHDDEKHPHVHLSVKAMSKDGVRLNPRKADLQRWRELFAEKLRAEGIEANATPRKARGVVQKAEKQAVRQMERRGAKPRTKEAQRAAAQREAAGKGAHPNPAKASIAASRKDTQQAYGQVARVLATGDAEDKRLALDVVRFIQQFPAPLTQHETMVKQIKQEQAADRAAEKAKPQPEKGRRGGDQDKTR